jgi:hypothetical protein
MKPSRHFNTTAILSALLIAGAASAETLSVSCKDPTGRVLGVLGELGSNKALDSPDSMKGGVVTLSWKFGEPKAFIVVNTGSASSVSSVEGILAYRSDEQYTFFAQFPGAAYMFSVFPKPRRLLMSSHQLFLGSDSGSALAKTFLAGCEMTIQ